LPAAHAQAVLAVVPRKGARFLAKTLKSACQRGRLKTHKKEYKGLQTRRLFIRKPFAQTATTCGGSPPARGAAGPILKRNCHIKILCPMNNTIQRSIEILGLDPRHASGTRCLLPFTHHASRIIFCPDHGPKN